MNYYSTEIVNDIIDNSELGEIVDKIRQFNDDMHMLFIYFAFDKINLDYIYHLLEDDKNEVVFRSIDNYEFNIRNCPSAMIYRKYRKKDTTIYYILMICTKYSFKRLGYASSMLDDFIGRIKRIHNSTTSVNRTTDINHNHTTKIVLSSLDTAVSYYEKYGFSITTDTLGDHPVLSHFEIPEDNKPTCIMELSL